VDDREELLARARAERARRAAALGVVRAQLEEQPSAHSIRACARRWCSDITHLAADVVAALNSAETSE
jgi:hypothetical protein